MPIPAKKTQLMQSITVAFITMVLALWSWNAIAELNGFPAAQLKHAIAFLILLVVGRRIIRACHCAEQRQQVSREH